MFKIEVEERGVSPISSEENGVGVMSNPDSTPAPDKGGCAACCVACCTTCSTK
ncbi:hypothetical protein [Metasolibacillus meyeri]|uniref:hypothetical protein n=1 Tax=Metasolibacillus meyeri TaxID=1071052 RepID=UPI00187D1822|nr:hypothetical protein [Metasolibacillus meyeri]